MYLMQYFHLIYLSIFVFYLIQYLCLYLIWYLYSILCSTNIIIIGGDLSYVEFLGNKY